MFSLEKKRHRGDLVSLYNYLNGDCGKVGVSLFSHINSYRTRRNGARGDSGGMLGKIFSHWNGLPREVVKSLSLEVFLQEEVFHTEGDEALQLVAEKGCGCPIPGGIQGHTGCSSG